mgnify:CR=1 FL=1
MDETDVFFVQSLVCLVAFLQKLEHKLLPGKLGVLLLILRSLLSSDAKVVEALLAEVLEALGNRSSKHLPLLRS